MVATEDEALLRSMVAAGDEPELTSDEVGALMTLYTSLSRAAAAGWRLKAGKVANRFDATVDATQRLNRSQMFEHCMKMAELYSSRSGIQSIRYSASPDSTFDPVIGNVNAG